MKQAAEGAFHLTTKAPAQWTGVVWMLLAALSLAASNALVRELGQSLHSFQLVLFAAALSAPFVVPLGLRARRGSPRRTSRAAYGALLGVGAFTTVMWFLALNLVPLTEATAISFSAPLIVAALAGTLLGEKVGVRRWTAIAVGFVGTLIILRPGMIPFDVGTAVVLTAAASMAVIYLLMKIVARTEPPMAIMGATTVVQLIVSLPLAAALWQPVTLDLVPGIVAMSVAMVLGRLFMLQAFASADATLVMPLDFARLPFIAVIAYFAFGERPDLWTILGSVLIAGAASFVLRREEALKPGETVAPKSLSPQ